MNIGDKLICRKKVSGFLVINKIYELEFGGKGGGGWYIICENGESLAISEYHIGDNEICDKLFDKVSIKELRRMKLDSMNL